jgi:hypothetical protein
MRESSIEKGENIFQLRALKSWSGSSFSHGKSICHHLAFVTILLISTLNCVRVFAYEIDYTKGRFEPLKDSTKLLDKEVKRRFTEVLNSVNKDKVGCDPVAFRTYLQEAIAPGDVIGVLERWAEGGIGVKDEIRKLNPFVEQYPGLPRHKSEVKTSIFKNAKGNYLFKKWWVGLGSNIRVNGQFIGTDKLGHFFDQGFRYFKDKVVNGRTDHEILSAGKDMEKLEEGKGSNGIASNADLAANFYGFQFWQEVTDGSNPYFKCESGKWRQDRGFTWATYVNSAWDEGINCNEYDPELEKTVKENIKELNSKPENIKEKRNFDCPMSEEGCFEATAERAAFYFLYKPCYEVGWRLRKARRTNESTRANPAR